MQAAHDATLTVDYNAAHAAFHAYQKLLRSDRAMREDVMLYKAYRAIMRGQKVLDLTQAMRTAGVDSRSRPKLAIAQADWPFVHVWRHSGVYRFSKRSEPWGKAANRVLKGETSVTIPNVPFGFTNARAVVPLVPPQFRPKHGLSNYHVLWEAAWESVPTDPFLLKHLDGPFYAVLAVWDLTPLEQAVLRARV